MLSSQYLLLVAICLIFEPMDQVFAQTTANPKRDEVCEGLKGTEGNKLNIWAVGLLRKTLLVVTKDWVVYNVPRTSLDETVHKLYLSEGEPMSKKWPKLWNDEKFSHTKENTMDTMIFVFPDKEVICFVYFARDGPGVNYDMTNHQVDHNGWKQFEDQNLVFIATTQLEVFHSTTNNPDKKKIPGIFIDKWRKDGPKHYSRYESYRPICWKDKPNTIVVVGPGQSCPQGNEVRWPMCKGFISQNSFYLFGETSVHVFPADTYAAQEPRKLTEIGYKDFFMCPGEAHNDSQSSILWLIIALILLLILLLCLILFCITYVYRRNKRRRWKPAKFQSSKSLASIRSSGPGSNYAVGLITKVFSSSHKSNTKFSTRSSPKTKRSALKQTPSSKKRLSKKGKTKNKKKRHASGAK